MTVRDPNLQRGIGPKSCTAQVKQGGRYQAGCTSLIDNEKPRSPILRPDSGAQ